MKKTLFLIPILALLLLVACNSKDTGAEDVELNEDALENVNDTGMPIVKEGISLNIFAGNAPASNDDWNDVMIFNEYEKMTNIDVEWEMVPYDSLSEKRNLALGSGKLPDVFYNAAIPKLDLLKYGKQGTFIKLNDLIDEYAPNLKQIFKEYPEVERALTFPDGNIYSFPTITSPDFISFLTYSKPWIRQDWLDNLGMDMPETTDEFREYLKAVKEQDPNGNGESDEVPFGADTIDGLISWLKGAYGISNRGINYIDMDPKEEKVRFYPITDEYKEMLEFVHELYDEGLIDQSIFTIEWDQYLTNASDGKYGSTVFNSPEELFGGDIGKKYAPAPALEGPYGDKEFTMKSFSVAGIGAFSITNENDNPAATVRWMDHFYSDEGSKFFFMGKEGVTYEKTSDGEYEYVDEIKNREDGLSLDQALSKYLTWPGGGYPGIVKEEFFKGAEGSPSEKAAAEVLKPDVIEESWPWSGFNYTEEESDILSTSGTDIEKYVSEMRDKFITGDEPFSEWDNYVKTIEGMGLDKYLEIQQTAYERYKNN